MRTFRSRMVGAESMAMASRYWCSMCRNWGCWPRASSRAAITSSTDADKVSVFPKTSTLLTVASRHRRTAVGLRTLPRSAPVPAWSGVGSVREPGVDHTVANVWCRAGNPHSFDAEYVTPDLNMRRSVAGTRCRMLINSADSRRKRWTARRRPETPAHSQRCHAAWHRCTCSDHGHASRSRASASASGAACQLPGRLPGMALSRRGRRLPPPHPLPLSATRVRPTAAAPSAARAN